MICDEISGQIKKALQALGLPVVAVEVEHPAQEGHGDYATNVAFRVKSQKLKVKSTGQKSKVTKFKSPLELAEAIAEQLKVQSPKSKVIKKVEVAGPGFINFWLSEDFLVSELFHVLDLGEGYGKGDALKGKKIMVEFAHPNTHKEMHIGHMRTLIGGEALARIFEHCGARVFRANYQGDIGPHVAKAMWGLRRIREERKMGWEAMEALGASEKAHLLGEGYVRGNKEYEEHKEEIDALNAKLYKRDPGVMPEYERTRRWSLEYYDSLYQRFGTRFDRLYFESEVAEPGKKLVLEHLGKVFEQSQGAVIFDGERYGLHKRVFVTKDGHPTYEAKDIGLAPLQHADFPFDTNIHVVAHEQSGYFQVIFKALELTDAKFSGRQYHLPMGMVQLVGKKMSSRTGVLLTVDGLLDEVKRLIKPLISSTGLSPSEVEEIAEMGTLAAVKYSVLRTGMKLDVLFDPQKSVSLKGDSGPYLQYTHARAQSVVRKSGKQTFKGSTLQAWELNAEERAVLRWLYRFPEVVSEAAVGFAPNLVCGFLHELAARFNSFYDKHSILGNNEKEVMSNGGVREFRLELTAGVAQVLRNGLWLLGIAAPEKM